jgi:hypothetical protein
MSSYLYLPVSKVHQTDIITEDRDLTLESRVRCSFLHWPLTSSEKIWGSGGSKNLPQRESRHAIRKSTSWSQFYLSAIACSSFCCDQYIPSPVQKCTLHAACRYCLVGMDMKKEPCFVELAILNDLIHSKVSLNKQEICQSFKCPTCESRTRRMIERALCAT